MMAKTNKNTSPIPAQPTRLRSRSGPDYLIAPTTSKSRACHNNIHSVALNSSNMSHQITIISQDIKCNRELNKTIATLKQLQKDYIDLIELTEAEQLFHETRECILNDKNAILENLVAEYKEKYQRIVAKNKYIDNERDSLDIDIPILEIDTSGSDSRITSLRQSLQIANENISRKDNKIKQLTEQLTLLQRTNQELTENIEQLQLESHLMNTDLDQSYNALESQILQLTEHNRMLKKEKTDLQDLLERKHDTLFTNDTNSFNLPQSRFQSMMGLSSPTASGLEGLNNLFDNAMDPLVFVRIPSHSYNRSHVPTGSVLNMKSTRMDDDMHTIEEEHDVTDPEQLSVSDKQFSVSQDSRSMGVMSDGEDDVVEQLMQNEEFINCDAVTHLKRYNTKHDNAMAQYLHLTACAVKIKYSNSKIKTDDLIRRVKHCSFYQYYDQMVRILEMEKKTNKSYECNRKLTTTEKLVKQTKYTRNKNSIMNLKNIKSVTKNIEQWERQSSNSPPSNENKLSYKKKKRKSKKDIKNKYNEMKTDMYNGNNSIYKTMIYKKEDIEKAKCETYGFQD